MPGTSSIYFKAEQLGHILEAQVFVYRQLLAVLAVCGVLALQNSAAGAQCRTSYQNLTSVTMERFGKHPVNHSTWVGQRFTTDCDGQFLTVRFQIYLDVVGYDGGTPLTLGDAVTCSILDDQYRLIASVDEALTHGFNFGWMEFNFEPLQLGLAAGDLIATLDTPLDAYGYVATDNNVAPGDFVMSYNGSIVVRDQRDAAFYVAWDPFADIVAETPLSWGAVKSLYR